MKSLSAVVLSIGIMVVAAVAIVMAAGNGSGPNVRRGLYAAEGS